MRFPERLGRRRTRFPTGSRFRTGSVKITHPGHARAYEARIQACPTSERNLLAQSRQLKSDIKIESAARLTPPSPADLRDMRQQMNRAVIEDSRSTPYLHECVAQRR